MIARTDLKIWYERHDKSMIKTMVSVVAQIVIVGS